MQKKISTIIFDLDGVITNSFADVADAVNKTLEVLGLAPRSYEYIKKHFNNGDRNLVAKALGAEKMSLLEEAMSLYFTLYEKNCFHKTTLFPGVKEVLEYYRNKNLAVLTNKIEKISRFHLEQLGVAHYFKLIAGPESVPELKPAPDGIFWLMKELGAERKETVMVGDSLADIQAGKAAGVITCALTSGYSEREKLCAAEPDLMLDSLGDLTKFFL